MQSERSRKTETEIQERSAPEHLGLQQGTAIHNKYKHKTVRQRAAPDMYYYSVSEARTEPRQQLGASALLTS